MHTNNNQKNDITEQLPARIYMVFGEHPGFFDEADENADVGFAHAGDLIMAESSFGRFVQIRIGGRAKRLRKALSDYLATRQGYRSATIQLMPEEDENCYLFVDGHRIELTDKWAKKILADMDGEKVKEVQQ